MEKEGNANILKLFKRFSPGERIAILSLIVMILAFVWGVMVDVYDRAGNTRELQEDVAENKQVSVFENREIQEEILPLEDRRENNWKIISGEKVTDSNGNQYETIILAGKTWLADNLRCPVLGSSCYNNDPNACEKYGLLYTWEAAEEACGCLGEGWRLPNRDDLLAIKELYDSENPNNYLDIDTSGFFSALMSKIFPILTSEINDYKSRKIYRALIKGGRSGFNATFGGGTMYKDSISTYLHEKGFYWTGIDVNEIFAIVYCFRRDNITFFHFPFTKRNSSSVRCLRD